MPSLILLLALFSSEGKEPASCDAVEINHLATEVGFPQFTQVICWRRTECGTYVCEDYRRARDITIFHDAVYFHYAPPAYDHYPEREKRLVIYSDTIVETWTTQNPESDNRQVYPFENRKRVWK